MSIDSEANFFSQLEQLEGRFFNGILDDEASKEIPPKSFCGACNRALFGDDAIHIQDKKFHDACFRCPNCGSDLSHLNADGRSRRQTSQSTDINGSAGFSWKSITPEESLHYNKIREHGEPLSFEHQDKTCKVCGTQVPLKRCYYVPTGVIHRSCFRCKRCSNLLDIHTFRVRAGELYCDENCPKELEVFQPNGTLSIDSLQSDPFLQFIPVNQSLFNEEVVRRMNGTHNCKRCRKPCLPHELVERAGNFYHRNCVRCAVCHQLVSISDRWWINGVPYCEKHFIQQYQYELSTLKTKPYPYNGQHTVFVRNSRPLLDTSQDIPNETHLNPTTGRVVTSAIIRPNKEHVVPFGMPYPVASPQSTSEDVSAQSLLERIPRSQSYDHIHRLRRTTVPSTPSNSKIVIEYQCHICGKLIPGGQYLSYSSQIYHENCARCKICRASSKEGKLCLYHKELFCSAHNPESKRDSRAHVTSNYLEYSSGRSTTSPKDPKKGIGAKRVELLVHPTSTWEVNQRPVFMPQTSVGPTRGILRNSR